MSAKSKAKKLNDKDDMILNKWMKPKDKLKSSISESSETEENDRSFNSQKSQRSAEYSINDKDRQEMVQTLQRSEQVYKSHDESSHGVQIRS